MSSGKNLVLIQRENPDTQLMLECCESLDWDVARFDQVNACLPYLCNHEISKILVDQDCIENYLYDIPRIKECVDSNAQVIVYRVNREIPINGTGIRIVSGALTLKTFLKEVVCFKTNITHSDINKQLQTDLLGESDEVVALREKLLKLSHNKKPLLLYGDKGNGKQYFARILHKYTIGFNGFHVVDLSSLPIEASKLSFAHVLDYMREIQNLYKSTIYIKNFHLLNASNQAFFITHFKKQKEFYDSLGEPLFRLVIALNDKKNGAEFRKSFKQIISGEVIYFSPLKDRPKDIASLSRHFLNANSNLKNRTLSQGVLDVLTKHQWSNNIQELKIMICQLAATNPYDEITVNDLPQNIKTQNFINDSIENKQLAPDLDTIEYYYIQEVLNSVQGNISKAARLLGVARNTLKSKIRKFSHLHQVAP